MLLVKEAHTASRAQFGLPAAPPKAAGGVKCGLCVNDCRTPLGGKGYCGLRTNVNGKLVHLAGTPEKGLLEWYYDALPTNCVANRFCHGCIEYGYKNLAVFLWSMRLQLHVLPELALQKKSKRFIADDKRTRARKLCG